MKIKDLSILFKSNRFRYGCIIALTTVLAFILGKKLLKYYGAKPSKKDSRDYKIAGAGIAGIPNSFKLPIPQIKNQGSVSSCVGHSMSYLSESVFKKTGEYTLDRFSVGFVYGFRPSGYYQGEGMYPREALKTLQQHGNVRYRTFPYNEEVPQITKRVKDDLPRLLTNAAENKVAVYFQLKTEEEIKTCLMKYGPVTVMYPVHEEFMKPINGKIDVRGLKNFQGYHQVSIYGWENDYWLMVNSWDTDWGNNGTALISMKYPWSEMWGVSTDPNAAVQKKTSFLKRMLG